MSHINICCLHVCIATTDSAGRLSVGCDVLDSSLQGGLLVPGLTEIAGTSAAGKTQLCLQLCLTSQLPRECGGLEAGEGCAGFTLAHYGNSYIARPRVDLHTHILYLQLYMQFSLAVFCMKPSVLT